MGSFALFSDEYFMSKALEEAFKADTLNEVPVGAVLVCQNQIIARAHNLSERLTDATAHAEMQVFTMGSDALGGKYLNDCTLFVTLEPCVMCAGAAYWAHLGRLVYGAVDDKRGYHLFSDRILHPKTAVVSGVLAEESRELIQSFFRRRR